MKFWQIWSLWGQTFDMLQIMHKNLVAIFGLISSSKKCKPSPHPKASHKSTAHPTANATTSRTRCGVSRGPRTSGLWNLNTRMELELLGLWRSMASHCRMPSQSRPSCSGPRMTPIHIWPLWPQFGVSLWPMTSAILCPSQVTKRWININEFLLFWPMLFS